MLKYIHKYLYTLKSHPFSYDLWKYTVQQEAIHHRDKRRLKHEIYRPGTFTYIPKFH